MSSQTMQERFNAQKKSFLRILKERGVYLYHCRELGFVYEIVIPILGEDYRFTIGFKNGYISVLNMEECYHDRITT